MPDEPYLHTDRNTLHRVGGHHRSSCAPLRLSRALRKLAWDDSTDVIAVDPRVARVVYALAAIEEDSRTQAVKVERTGFRRAADIDGFLPAWLDEEQEHGRFLFAVSGRCGLPRPEQIRTSGAHDREGRPNDRCVAHPQDVAPAWRRPTSSSVPPPSTSRGVMHSWMADELAATPRVARTFRELARQEARHFGFSRAAAQLRFEPSTLDRYIAPRVFRRWWRPVRIDTLGWDAWLASFDFLLGDATHQDRRHAFTATCPSVPECTRAANRLPGRDLEDSAISQPSDSAMLVTVK